MKTWAEIDINNKVINTILSSDSFISSLPGTFIECTELTGIGSSGMTYNKEKNKFVHSQPYPSWTLNQETLEWESPVGNKPLDGSAYTWNEESVSWEKLISVDIEL